MGYLWPNFSRSCRSSKYFLLTVIKVFLKAPCRQRVQRWLWIPPEFLEQWISLEGGGHSGTVKIASQNPKAVRSLTKRKFLMVHSSPDSRERANRASNQTKNERHISKTWLFNNLSKTTQHQPQFSNEVWHFIDRCGAA